MDSKRSVKTEWKGNRMNVEEILGEWKKDSTIRIDDLVVEGMDVPSLHSKYLTLLSQKRLALKRLKVERDVLTKDLHDYFLGHLNTDSEKLKEMQREPFEFRVLKNEIFTYIQSDGVMIKMNAKIAYAEESVDVLTEILKSINNRNFAIKNSLDFMKMTQGP